MENENQSILEEVRSWKEDVAREHDFDIKKIIYSAIQRQKSSNHRIISLEEQDAGSKEKRALASG